MLLSPLMLAIRVASEEHINSLLTDTLHRIFYDTLVFHILMFYKSMTHKLMFAVVYHRWFCRSLQK